MLLTTGPSFEFIKFLQVLGWIILPVSLIAALITIIIHYRKKKSGIIHPASEEEKLIQAYPEQLGYTKGDGEYVFFDHSSLIGNYKKSLSSNHARYAALKHDFDKLKEQYTGLAGYTLTKFSHKKATIMENSFDQLPQPLQEEITKLSATYKTEKENLFAELAQIKQANITLEEENQSLRDQVNIQTATEDEKTAILRRWKDQNFFLKERIAEQQYLQEVVEEKKAQIGFLQNQLEGRIRNSHQSEQQREKAVAELEEERMQHVKTLQTVDSLKNELLLKQDELDKLQVALCGKEEQLLDKQQHLHSKSDQLTWLENVLQETKQHGEMLHASSMDDKNIIASLQEQFSVEESRVQYLEQKILANKQLMQRLHKELSAFVGEENGQSQVISLRPDFINLENEEAATR